MAYQGKYTGAQIDAQIGRVENGSVVTDNTLHEITRDDTKPVTGAAVEKGILAMTDSSVGKGSRNPVSGAAVFTAIDDAKAELRGRGYIYMGMADTTTVPDTSQGKVFYLASEKGEYPSFGGAEVTKESLSTLLWDGEAWSVELIADLVTPSEAWSIAKTEVTKIIPTIPRTNWSDTESISIPVPQRGTVNIIADSLPTTKTANIKGELEFWDMEGNYFKKCIILNAQGTSSLANAKKNFGIDIVGSDWDEDAPQTIKFGNWVAQDSFHLKAYMLDGVRIKSLVGYDFWEDILLSRGSNIDRAWKRALLPADMPNNSNPITELKLRYDNGAKGHPSGFPFELYHNGTFYGIYCWQLKKHRDNYHQDKNNANHIHLDGNISDILLWRAGGNIPWEKWAGREVESEDILNLDGIEVRNPKSLVLANGTKYDADTNNGELMGYNSPLYDSSNEYHLRTAKVREAIESLSARTTALAGITSASDKKAAFEAIFDVDSLVDYVLFTLVVGNNDGMKKNWQWTTYDGVKWFVNAYDLDGILGWNGWNYFSPPTTDTGLVYTPAIEIITRYYGNRLRMRYAELRTMGIITVDNIANKLSNYIRVVGEEAFEKEFNKWGNESPTDSEWRIVEWIKTAIANLDDYYDYPGESLQRYADYEAFGAERTPDGWLLNGVLLTPADIDISWRNRVQGTNLNNAYVFAQQSATNGGRLKTIFPIDNMINSTTRYINLERAFANATTIKVIRFTKRDRMCEVSSLRQAFSEASSLQQITTPLSLEWATNVGGAFTLCSELEEVRLYKLNASISFAYSPLLSKESLVYMISNAGTAAITITLHADTLAWASTDADVQAALANKTNVTIK